MDTVQIDLTVKCEHVQLGPETIFEVYTWIGDAPEIVEQMAAWRMRWA